MNAQPKEAPFETWRWITRIAPAKPLPRGLDRWAVRAQGAWRRRRISPVNLIDSAEKVLERAAPLRGLSDDALREQGAQTVAARRSAQVTEPAEAFPFVVECVRRVLGFEFHPCQIAAGMAMTQGGVAELATGEGKTLAAVLPTWWHAALGLGCHVMTVNDYLAHRDAQTVAPIFAWSDLSVDALQADQGAEARSRAYAADVTYGTPAAFAADHSRDRILLGGRPTLASLAAARLGGRPLESRLLTRGRFAAVVDECDSVLVDDAVTPLLLSAEGETWAPDQARRAAASLAGSLTEGTDFLFDKRSGLVRVLDPALKHLERSRSERPSDWVGPRASRALLEIALRARATVLDGRDYLVENGRVVLVDEGTGRTLQDRRWRGGLHEAVEAKEGVEIQSPTETLARISFQRFFAGYRFLAGMTGTAWEVRDELFETYGLIVVRLPTHRPVQRRRLPVRLVPKQDDKDTAILEEIRAAHGDGRPVLVGTRSVAESERVAELAEKAGFSPRLLNARTLAEEADIIAKAGAPLALTIATNLAGRGTDIPLGEGVAARGGLHVVATDVHASARVDRQLEGRAGRQGDPGSARTIFSASDEIWGVLPFAWVQSRSREGFAVMLATRVAQALVQRRAHRIRRSMLIAEEHSDQSLAFAPTWGDAAGRQRTGNPAGRRPSPLSTTKTARTV